MTSDLGLATLLDQHRCDEQHNHFPVTGEKLARTASYPYRMCDAIARYLITRNLTWSELLSATGFAPSLFGKKRSLARQLAQTSVAEVIAKELAL